MKSLTEVTWARSRQLMEIKRQIGITLNLVSIMCAALAIADITNAGARVELTKIRHGHAAALERISYLETLLEARGIVTGAEPTAGPVVQEAPFLGANAKEQE
jgi:hypothetical protein